MSTASFQAAAIHHIYLVVKMQQEKYKQLVTAPTC
jgi:hypothetical protein